MKRPVVKTSQGIITPTSPNSAGRANGIRWARKRKRIFVNSLDRNEWYGPPDAASNAIGYAMHRSRSCDAVIRVYDVAGNLIETHEHAGEFKER